MTSLRVLSYNIHSSKDDLAALARVVREIAPDVMIVQEAPRRFRWRQKCADLARSFDLVVAGGGLPALGNLILTSLRVRAREAWPVQYPLTPGRHMRGAQFVRCTVGRTGLIVAGSHLSIDAAERPAQATLLKKYLNEADEPVVFGGDLNENSGGAAWRTLADGLVDAAVAVRADARPTFPAGAPRERFDVVLVDPRWTVAGYDLVSTPDALAASDHLPLVVDLTFAATSPK